MSLLALLLYLAHLFRLRRKHHGYGRRLQTRRVWGRTRQKPHWVKVEVICLKALMHEQGGCRTIADNFNRRFGHKRNMSIGKPLVSALGVRPWCPPLVSDILRRHRYAIDITRGHLKNAKPRRVPRNLVWVWGVDLTGKIDPGCATHCILAIVDHASRAALILEALRDKSSSTLIAKLIKTIRRYGKPRLVRTDNEPVLVSRRFRLALATLGIRHQRTAPGCPWQNGRVERFFGTLKRSHDDLAVDSLDALNFALVEFRFYYNYVRPHQNLNGKTPAEAWAGVDPHAQRVKTEYWFEAWEGLLVGYYWRR